MRRFSVFAALVAGLLLVLLPSATAGNGPKNKVVDVQLLAFNDFHGQLEPPTGSGANVQTDVKRDASGAPIYDANGKTTAVNTVAGGMEYLATYVAQLRAESPHTLVVSAGDSIGASPLLSAMFHDEPTIEALNLIGTRFSAVGNHDFDEGPAELLRMQYGGCHPVDGCQDGTPFAGADFKYLASNVTWTDSGQTIFPPYRVQTVAGVKVAFIGATLQAAPSIVTAAGVAGLTFLPEVASVNAVVDALQAEGVHTFVLLLHQGGQQKSPYSNGLFAQVNGCDNLGGDIVPILAQLDPDVDVVVSGHTHNAYVCKTGDRVVTAALSSGRLISDIDLQIDSDTDQVVGRDARNVIVTRDVPKNQAITDLIAHYNTYGAPIANQVVGSITGDIKRASTGAAESALGDVIADAQFYAMAPQGAIAAVTNPGGLRADLTYSQSSGGEAAGEVTYGELFAVQPFNNYMVVKDVTGQQLYNALEQQWTGGNSGGNAKLLQVSAGITYQWHATPDAFGHRVVPDSLFVNGIQVQALSTYRIALNNFLSDGGDNFSALAGGANAVSGMLDIDAAVAYFGTHPGVAPGPMNRIIQIP